MNLDEDNDDLAAVVDDTVPFDVCCLHPVFCLSFHPASPFLAIGQVSGALEIHEFKGNQTRYAASLTLHDGGITGMEFTENGSHLVTVSSDKTINVLDCNTQQSVVTIAVGKGNPHKYGISAVNICTETLVATGDDDGQICVFDMRTKKAVMKYHEHGDYVSQMLFFSEVNQIVSGSGDTCLGVYDFRAGEVIDYSDKRKDEINAMAFVPETNDIICGTPSGSLPVWRYGSWARPYDAYEYHPRDCEVMITYNDNIILTGACDGMIRVLQVHPVKRNICQLGGNQRKQEVSTMSISHNRRLIACAGNDHIVSFVDIGFLSNDNELDRLRSRAEQRHVATLREATAEMDAEKERERRLAAEENEKKNDKENSSSDSNDSDAEEDSSSSDSDSAEINEKLAPTVGDDVGEGDNGIPLFQKSLRQKKRERVAAAKWLKEEKKKKVNFNFERRRRRVHGFFGDMKEY